MGTNKTDVNDTTLVIDSHHQTVVIPFDVKDDSIISHHTGVPINPFYISFGVFQTAFLVSSCQASKDFCASGCCSQKALSVFRETILILK